MQAARPVWWLVTQISGGLVLLVVGGRLLVTAATDAATALGVSELVVGLTVVAVGTSLPELATSVLAAIRGERDIAVANVVGSNIFNVLTVLGISTFVCTESWGQASGISVRQPTEWCHSMPAAWECLSAISRQAWRTRRSSSATITNSGWNS